MSARSREGRLVGAFVALADTLVADYDVVDLLQSLVDECTVLFDASAAGILLVDSANRLDVVASTNQRSADIELMQVRSGQGPCIEAVASGEVVSVPDLDRAADRWPTFAADARRSGFSSIHSIPLRLRDATIGSLNLFGDTVGELNHADAVAAQALADVATIGILSERVHRESALVQDQLQHALDSRVIIEQAKGYLAQTEQIDMDTAFSRIRSHARATRMRLAEVAAQVVEGRLQL
jgi:transcriptional regulator with GAF, ATPase, and Fis domain